MQLTRSDYVALKLADKHPNRILFVTDRSYFANPRKLPVTYLVNSSLEYELETHLISNGYTVMEAADLSVEDFFTIVYTQHYPSTLKQFKSGRFIIVTERSHYDIY